MPLRKIDEGVSSAVACAKPKRTCAGLWSFIRANFDFEVAHNDVKMGFAISDEVIQVLLSYIYFFISMASCWKRILNYIQMTFAIDLKGELGQPNGYAFEADDISYNFLVYYESDYPVAGVAADVIQIMAIVVFSYAAFSLLSNFTDSNNINIYLRQLIHKL